MGVALHVYVHAYFRIPENLLQALQDVFPYLAQGTPGCGHVRWGPTDLSGRIPLNLLSPFACTGFCFVFRSPHRVSSDTDLAQRRIRTSCVYVTHLILWSDFSVRLSTIPVTVTTNSSFSIRRSLDAGATSFSGRSLREIPNPCDPKQFPFTAPWRRMVTMRPNNARGAIVKKDRVLYRCSHTDTHCSTSQHFPNS